MKMQELILKCQYSEGGSTILQIINGSFDSFLKKELQNVEKYLLSIV